MIAATLYFQGTYFSVLITNKLRTNGALPRMRYLVSTYIILSSQYPSCSHQSTEAPFVCTPQYTVRVTADVLCKNNGDPDDRTISNQSSRRLYWHQRWSFQRMTYLHLGRTNAKLNSCNMVSISHLGEAMLHALRYPASQHA